MALGGDTGTVWLQYVRADDHLVLRLAADTDAELRASTTQESAEDTTCAVADGAAKEVDLLK